MGAPLKLYGMRRGWVLQNALSNHKSVQFAVLLHQPSSLVGGLLCENAPLAASCTTVSTFRTAPDPSLGMSLPDFAGVNGMPPRSRCNFPSIVWPTDGHAIKVTKQALPASIKLQTLHVQARMTPTARIPKLGRNQGLKCFIFVRGKP
jgi:hypothetical protein